MAHFGDLQNAIYRDGAAGRRPRFPLTPDDLERAARGVMSDAAWAYVAGGAGTERTMRANTEAFERRRLVPRMLREVVGRDLTTELFGRRIAAPLLTAPIGALGLVHPEPELAVAAVTARLGVGAVITTMAQAPLEHVAAAAPEGLRWYQLYWPADDEVAESMVRRAEAAGYGAIVVTLDTWTLGWRPRDLARGSSPFLAAIGLANHLTDPVFRSKLAAPPEISHQAMRAAVDAALGIFGRPSLTWQDLSLLRQWTSLPVVVKGVCHPDDARAAVDAGMDGIIVSNHGGRQVDGARAALDCLADVADAVGERTTLLFDSGIRCAADVVVALALGARAVLLGRPWVHGLALGGADGIDHVLRHLLAELDLTLALCGHSTPATLDRTTLGP
ncbi:MAG TPA: alpha-hydroxy-acid oxidizing protein [Pseudonocardiaceae bacterium]